MTDLRREFYEAVQKASIEWEFNEDLDKIGKGYSLETDHQNNCLSEIDKLIIETSRTESAINLEKFEYNNEDYVNHMYNLTKKSEQDLDREKNRLEQERLLEIEKEKERIKYRNYIRKTEKFQNYFTKNLQSVYIKSSSGKRTQSNSSEIIKYVFTDYGEDDYVD